MILWPEAEHLVASLMVGRVLLTELCPITEQMLLTLLPVGSTG